VQKTLINNLGFKKTPDFNEFKSNKNSTLYSENFLKEELFVNTKIRLLAIGIFLYYFIENGTLGLVPSKLYFVYRNMRISDFLLYGLTLYSLSRYKEYKDLFKSKPFLIAKIFIAYFLFEFVVSVIRYDLNPFEYFFRLKGPWSTFLVFPFMLLIKRGGFPFLIKIIFPVSVISNILYIISALTGIPLLPDVSIVSQSLPGDIVVFRVFGGTFFGEIFFLGIIYYWITKRFRVWQISFAFLFILPHVLAFGRLAWAFFAFTILVMVILNSLNKRNFKLLFRQVVILIILGISMIFIFIKFIPESDFYISALNARIFQGQDDYTHSEGTYGTRVIMQNVALLELWRKSDLLLGIGMHPMWVIGPESKEEAILYGAFSDVAWPSVLAAYGLIGFAIACIIQFYYAVLALKMIRINREINIYTMLVTLMFSKFLFDSTVGFSYVFLTTGLWGFFVSLNIYIPVLIYLYEKNRKEKIISKMNRKTKKIAGA
jgi:hypothetical protein